MTMIENIWHYSEEVITNSLVNVFLTDTNEGVEACYNLNTDGSQFSNCGQNETLYFPCSQR